MELRLGSAGWFGAVYPGESYPTSLRRCVAASSASGVKVRAPEEMLCSFHRNALQTNAYLSRLACPRLRLRRSFSFL